MSNRRVSERDGSTLLPNADEMLELRIRESLSKRGFSYQSIQVRGVSGAGHGSKRYKLVLRSTGRNGSGQALFLKIYSGSRRRGMLEYQAISRLHGDLDGIPRPIDYLPEMNAVLMEYIDGLNLRRHLMRRLFLPSLPGAMPSTISSLVAIGEWLRRFQERTGARLGRTTLGEIVANEAEGLSCGQAGLSISTIDRLQRMFDDNADLSVDAVESHGDFHARNLILSGTGHNRALYVIDWPALSRRHIYYDLHDVTLNMLSWSGVPVVSVTKAREFGAAVENGYFGSQQRRDSAYWLTRASHLIYELARRTRMLQLPIARGAPERKWRRVVHQELERCIASV